MGNTFTVGGAERVVGHLARGLHRRPIDHPSLERSAFMVDVLALREPGAVGEDLRAGGLEVYSGLTGAGRVDPLLLHRLRGFLRRGGYEVIYFLDHAHAVFYGAIASLGTPARVLVMPVHTTGQWGGRPSIRRPIRMVRARLDRIIAIADAQRRYLIEEEGIGPEQITVIPNGIPIRSPSAEERARNRAAARARIGASAEALVIGITAVLRPEKNHELLLRAFAGARAAAGARASTNAHPSGNARPSASAHPSGSARPSASARPSGVSGTPMMELWIMGEGPRREFLEDEAARLGLGESVRFLGQRDDAREVMPGFDIAVLTSHPRVETLPLALLEAMDAGLPVVSTRVGALPEMVEHERSGLLVEPEGEAELTAALLRLLGDPATRRAMGERGQTIARERFSVERMVDSTATLLLDLMARKTART